MKLTIMVLFPTKGETRKGGGNISNSTDKGIIVFRKEELAPILQSTKNMTIRPSCGGVVKENTYYELKTSFRSRNVFGTLVIESVALKKLGELTEMDIRNDGYISYQEWQEHWVRSYGIWDPDLEVRLIRFRVVDT